MKRITWLIYKPYIFTLIYQPAIFMKINQKLCSWNKTLYKTWNNDYIKHKLLCLNTFIQKKKEEENNKDGDEEKEEENKGTEKRTPNQEVKGLSPDPKAGAN